VKGTNVFAGGAFNDLISDIDNVGRFDGTSWNGVGGGLNNTVNELAIIGNRLYAGGGFINAGSDPLADYIAYWEIGAFPENCRVYLPIVKH